MRPGPPAEQIPNPEPRYCEEPCPQSCAPACYDWCCYPAILPPTQPVKIVMVKKPANPGTPQPLPPYQQQINMQNDPCMYSTCYSKKDIVANSSHSDVKLNLNSNQSSSLPPSNATDLNASQSNVSSLNETAMIDGNTNTPLNSSIEKSENLNTNIGNTSVSNLTSITSKANAVAGNDQAITLGSVAPANETATNKKFQLGVNETSNFANSTSKDGKIESSSNNLTAVGKPSEGNSSTAGLFVTKDTYKKTTTEVTPNKSHKRSHLKHKNHKGFIRTEM